MSRHTFSYSQIWQEGSSACVGKERCRPPAQPTSNPSGSIRHAKVDGSGYVVSASCLGGSCGGGARAPGPARVASSASICTSSEKRAAARRAWVMASVEKRFTCATIVASGSVWFTTARWRHCLTPLARRTRPAASSFGPIAVDVDASVGSTVTLSPSAACDAHPFGVSASAVVHLAGDAVFFSGFSWFT